MPPNFSPLVDINPKDKIYTERARGLRLPEISKKGELNLWDNEAIEIKEDRLWANLGCARGKWRPGIEYNWIFQYRKTMIGIPVSKKERAEPESDPVIPIFLRSGSNTRGLWLLICTNSRLVTFTTHYERLGTRKKFWTIYFPWNMLSVVEACKEQSSFFSGDKYSLKLLFCLKEWNYLLNFGDFTYDSAHRHFNSIYKLALEAKMTYAESRIPNLPSTEVKENLKRTLNVLKEELEAKLQIDRKGGMASQTYFPQLKPEVYFEFVTK